MVKKKTGAPEDFISAVSWVLLLQFKNYFLFLDVNTLRKSSLPLTAGALNIYGSVCSVRGLPGQRNGKMH